MYAPLFTRSNFSFLEGASHPAELVERAKELGLPALALTDRDGLYGVVRAHMRAKELGVKLLIGAQVTLEDHSTLGLLSTNRLGYQNLCRLLTKGRLRSEKGQSRVHWAEVCDHAPGLIALWGGESSALALPDTPVAVAAKLKEAFGDGLYALITRHRRAEDVALEQRLRERAAALELPVVAANEVLYHSSARRPLCDILTCIRHGTSVHTAGRLLKPNTEYELKTPTAFEALWADDRVAIARTLEVAERCTFSMSELRYRYPSERLPDGSTSSSHLRALTMEGARWRYGGKIPSDVLAQLEKELGLIDDLDYCGYFLTMKELVEYCKAHHILAQGRGSAANSAVCYVLGITAVDPVRMGLLFERFISKERAEPPDIDLDIEHERREEVIQHVYQRYGRTHAAMVANVITFRAKSAVREVGKALGIPETNLERLSKLLGHYDGVDQAIVKATALDTTSELTRHLFELAGEIVGFPRHLSIHPGGFLLGHEPIDTLVPVENATMEARTVIQWDKDDVESLGLFKVDLLGLGALTHLHGCFDLLKKYRGLELSMATIPPADQAAFDLICRADTVGVFQIESRAQMAMLPRLKPRTYYDLVIEVSIVRPGPITGGMVHPYLRRRQGLEAIEYPHPSLEPVLAKTLGIPLFQEQVMRLAVVAADYTPGEADQLRRDMAAWRKTGRLEGHHEKLISRMTKKGIAPEFAERVFKQICGFGEYGFPESHAASFALISYAGAYLRAHYPAEFTCGLLNALPMGFYSAATIVEDAKRHGVEVRPIDVTRSEWNCTLEPAAQGTFAVRMGIRFVKSLSPSDYEKIVRANPKHCTSLLDFEARAALDEGALKALAEAGTLDAISLGRREALWGVLGLSRQSKKPIELDDDAPVLFDTLTKLETIGWDYRRAGHSARGHPLEEMRSALAAQSLPTAREVSSFRNGRPAKYAGLVICRQRPGTAAGVTFMTLEDETGFVNVVVWKDVFDTNAVLLKTTSFLGVRGKIQQQDGVVHLVADGFFVPGAGDEIPKTTSHDFH